MKVFMLTWKSFGNEDIKDAFEKVGLSVIEYLFLTRANALMQNWNPALQKQSIKQFRISYSLLIIFPWQP